ncbi:hypothetical protein FP026_27225 [Rhizobium tropici]|uniref:Uncharacterized protein n=2 Tax=Rhizobium tropici TaxID=398 RepID=A0A5B0VRQ6_RHITR|nr:hypothetical protein FP026_27225 [Rhizobium tropici]
MLYWLQHRNGPGSMAHRSPPQGNHAMLVFIIAGAIVGSFLVEYLVHLFADYYEIEWDSAFENGKDVDFAQEIATAMRKTHRESERQMNKLFKVASGAHC